jgi:hypothetical protein
MKMRSTMIWKPKSLSSTVLFVLIAILRLHAANYCVDAVAGSDTNLGSCSPYSPWKTIAGAVNPGPSIKYQPGDVISFQGGQTFSGEIDLSSTNVGGTDAQRAANPITVNSTGTGRATISSSNGNGILMSGIAGVHVTNINFVGASLGGKSGFQGGVYFSNSTGSTLTYAHVDNVTISGFRYDGITVIGNNSSSGYADVRIDSVTIHDCGHDGIDIVNGSLSPPAYAMSNVYVGHSLVYNIPGIASLRTGSGQPVNFFSVNGGTVEYTTTHDSGQLNSPRNFGPVGISATNATNLTFQFNEVYLQHTGPTSNTDGDGFDLDAGVTNSVMQYNYSHNNDGAGFLLCGGGAAPNSNNTVRYNVSENDGRNAYGGAYALGGISVVGFCAGSQGLGPEKIYNNTVYISGTGISSPAVRIVPQGGAVNNVQLYDNILITNNGLPQVELTSTSLVSGLSLIANLYYDSGSGYKVKWNGTTYSDSGDGSAIQQWAAATGEEQLPAGTYKYIASNPLVCHPGLGGTMYPNPLTNLGAYKLVVGTSASNSSPAIDSALNLQTNFGINPGSRDFYGDTIPTVIFNSTGGGFDRGADEAQAGQVCP